MTDSASKDPSGMICWLEIPVQDVSRAQKFYSELFGWECSKDPLPAPPETGGPLKGLYFFNSSRGGKVLHGAFMHLPDDHRVINHDPSRPGAMPILPTLNVDDCAETLKQAESLGGKTQWPKTSIGGDMGAYARLIDSEGNMIGVWSQN